MCFANDFRVIEVVSGSCNFLGHCLSVLHSKVGGLPEQKRHACPSLSQQFNIFMLTCVKCNSQEHSISVQPYLLSKNIGFLIKLGARLILQRANVKIGFY